VFIHVSLYFQKLTRPVLRNSKQRIPNKMDPKIDSKTPLQDSSPYNTLCHQTPSTPHTETHKLCTGGFNGNAK